ncbi:MAG: acyl carrier protein [Rhizobiaceae bacterium]
MKPIDAIIERVLREIGSIEQTPLAPHTRLREDLGLDSLTLIDVAVALEDAVGLAVPDEQLERMQTVGELAACLERTAIDSAT